ncbi:MAG: hypothetical protein ACFHXK_18900 [bacterium]
MRHPETTTRRHSACNLMLVVGLLVSVCMGCTGLDLDTVNPPGVNLSGQWLVDFSDSDLVPNLRNRPAGKPSRRVQGSVNREALRVADGSALAFIAHDFQVLRADKLTIEQNRDSMGLDYQPGVYRDVTWGERQRGLWEVRAGWEDQQLVIVSSARNMRVVERLTLTNPDLLQVQVSIDADGEQLEFLRVFNRQP